jgi:hypothetical protein
MEQALQLDHVTPSALGVRDRRLVRHPHGEHDDAAALVRDGVLGLAQRGSGRLVEQLVTGRGELVRRRRVLLDDAERAA